MTTNLHLTDNRRLTGVGLPLLETVGEDLVIYFNAALTDLRVMPLLGRIGYSLFIESNAALPTCEAERLRDQVLAAEGIGSEVRISNNDGPGTCEP